MSKVPPPLLPCKKSTTGYIDPGQACLRSSAKPNLKLARMICGRHGTWDEFKAPLLERFSSKALPFLAYSLLVSVGLTKICADSYRKIGFCYSVSGRFLNSTYFYKALRNCATV